MTGRVRPWMTEELTLLRDSASRFLAKEMAPHRERWEEEGLVDRAAWRKMGETGLLCASIPEAYGGGGGSYAHEIVIAEEMARAGLGGGLGAGAGVHSGIVAHYLLAYGTEEQKQRWLPGMASSVTAKISRAIQGIEPETAGETGADTAEDASVARPAETLPCHRVVDGVHGDHSLSVENLMHPWWPRGDPRNIRSGP